MPAPTAIKKDDQAPPAEVPQTITSQDENDLVMDVSATGNVLTAADATTAAADAAAAAAAAIMSSDDTNMEDDSGDVVDEEARPRFAAAKDVESAARREVRKVPIPPHRLAPLKASWSKIYTPLVDHLKLQVRMNVKTKAVELRTSRNTAETGAIQKGEDFVRAYAMGFDVEDAVAILRLDGIYIQSFEIKDVKTLEGDHLARAVGRIVGKDGRTKYAIENTTKTRIVVAGGSKIHILGGFKEIGMARESVVSLILGKPPGKVYGNLRSISARMKERF
ncbi:rRNA processing protein [Niveomyces insectorum RCEF 264]|uniref:Pre-rRNA-processing protein PNO1 n=1 Tax=Niveomyces insectorum RCEF 264 TaxID=1081102 RepID=A0A167REP5_9HYPO|nr:rRNA processing protein [Niveomyces insectorum RCEF 264]